MAGEMVGQVAQPTPYLVGIVATARSERFGRFLARLPDGDQGRDDLVEQVGSQRVGVGEAGGVGQRGRAGAGRGVDGAQQPQSQRGGGDAGQHGRRAGRGLIG
ncbi:hypothetical protein GCM10010191_71320 [Actinomadura vinacea]|uniref:Uncharacterized protein n=1 Tax=Actinomadura vinacea TaxID=115336 RepID=A0ABP5X3R8_9ACTN